MNIANHMIELVGKTPMVYLKKLNRNYPGIVAAKLEFFNPGSSVKDRIAKGMIEAGIKNGTIRPDTTLVEPTSGNTGIGLAFICAVMGLKVILTMPDSLSVERRKLLKGLGAVLVLTEGAKGMKGAIAAAEKICSELPGAVMLMQFENPANPDTHAATTAEEIWADTDGKIDAFVCGVGTGGTITGVGRVLKERNPDIRIIAVEPKDSPVLSGGKPGPHTIQGIGAGFKPGVLDMDVVDEVLKVSNEDALNMATRLIREEGILCGISSGATAVGATAIATRPEMQDKLIVMIAHDTAERYLSTPLFSDE
ncbi:MAG: cysteine synthase A [Proteobacteria bacterium]|nr:cysteine synthase A [Pseudomonadota bacterium]